MTSGNYRNVLKMDKDDFKRILTYQFTTVGVHGHFITILDINKNRCIRYCNRCKSYIASICYRWNISNTYELMLIQMFVYFRLG